MICYYPGDYDRLYAVDIHLVEIFPGVPKSPASQSSSSSSKFNTMTELKDAVFKNQDSLTRTEMIKFSVQGVEEILPDLEEYNNYDGVSAIATVVVRAVDGVVDQTMIHLLGESDSKRLEARNILGPDYEGYDHQVKIDKINLAARTEAN